MHQATFLTQCCRESTNCLVQQDHSSSTNTAHYTTTNADRSELQILKNRKSKAEADVSKYFEEGGEMMMTGAATEWEWGWGSGGGWLSEAACWDCDSSWVNGAFTDMFVDEVGEEVNGDLDNADAEADFGDFGF